MKKAYIAALLLNIGAIGYTIFVFSQVGFRWGLVPGPILCLTSIIVIATRLKSRKETYDWFLNEERENKQP